MKNVNAQYLDVSTNPKIVAEHIADIIHILVQRMSPEAQARAIPNLKGKFSDMNAFEISQKNNPGGASIGASITIVKNILNGRDPYFIQSVLDELAQKL
jgi:hypothetical protein